MSNVISIENLGKRYFLSHQGRQDSYLALRDVLTEGVKSLGRQLVGRSARAGAPEEFWALRDVSFDVRQGDRLGIIGRNGAGKSTLLKILSRITEPSTGTIRIKGKVVSLLEVGTGFHPELTGRENIFLNGAILGMRRSEIKRKFDEIVDFADVEKFLDTPVKRYSSGMYVRLAFAVAAHLEPDILVVDEVLAVGDARFQQKCLGKMEEVSAKEGRTVLFVSHNLSALRTLCTNAVIMEKGRLAFAGGVDAAVQRYLLAEGTAFATRRRPEGNRFLRVAALDANGERKDTFTETDQLFLNMQVNIESRPDVHCGITIYNSLNLPLMSSCVRDSFAEIHLGVSNYRLKIPVELLHSGCYRIEGAIWDQETVHDHSETLCSFNIVRNDSVLEAQGVASRGYLRFPHQWHHETHAEDDPLE